MLNEQHSGSFGNDSELVIFRTEAFKCVLIMTIRYGLSVWYVWYSDHRLRGDYFFQSLCHRFLITERG